MASVQADISSSAVKLRLWDIICLIVGIIIGVGIFKTPALIFANTSNIWQALIVWIAGGIFALIGALCFAELTSSYPRSGGEYVYLTRAFGSWTGFLFAWGQLAIIRAGSIGQIAYIFAQYSGGWFGYGDNSNHFNSLLAAAVILLLTAINIIGVRVGKNTQNLLTVLKVLGIGGILIAGFFFAKGAVEQESAYVVKGFLVQKDSQALVLRTPDQELHTWFLTPTTTVSIDAADEEAPKSKSTPADLRPGMRLTVYLDERDPQTVLRIAAVSTTPLYGLALALILVMWTYAGWHEAAYVVSETKNKRRTIPLAFLLGTAVVLLLYVFINVAYVAGLGFERAAESERIASDVLEQAFGEWGSSAMSLLVMISCLGALNGMIFTSARIYVEMGTDHPLLLPLSLWSKKLGTPVVSLLVQGFLCVSFVGFVGLFFHGIDGFTALLKCTAAVFWIFFFLTGIALFVLRRKDPAIRRPFAVPLYPVIPLLFCLACVGMIVASVNYAPVPTLIGLGVLLAGVPLFMVSNRMKKS